MWRSEDNSLQVISFLPVHELVVRVKVGTKLKQIIEFGSRYLSLASCGYTFLNKIC